LLKHMNGYTGWSKSLCAPEDYSTKNPHTIDDLKMAITEYTRNVYRAILNTVFENTVRRVNKCLETGGGAGGTLNIVFCIVMIRCTETFWSPCKILWPFDDLVGSKHVALSNTNRSCVDGFLLY
jgi:hypothetical protein